MTAKAPFKYSLNADRSVAKIELVDGTSFDLTTDQLQVVLLWLGQVRSEMRPSVNSEPLANEQIAPIADWRVEPIDGGHPAEVGGRIMFRSIHFGWFAIPLSPEGFRHLSGGIFGAPIAKPPGDTVQ